MRKYASYLSNEFNRGQAHIFFVLLIQISTSIKTWILQANQRKKPDLETFNRRFKAMKNAPYCKMTIVKYYRLIHIKQHMKLCVLTFDWIHQRNALALIIHTMCLTTKIVCWKQSKDFTEINKRKTIYPLKG